MIRQWWIQPTAAASLLVWAGSCGSGISGVLNGEDPGAGGGGTASGHVLSDHCKALLAHVQDPECAEPPPDLSPILDTGGKCIRDGYVAMAVMYCWYAKCTPSTDPETAAGAEQCALHEECLALELCGGESFADDPCKSLELLKCEDPPMIDCAAAAEGCSLPYPVPDQNCDLGGANAVCASDGECCSEVCTLENGSPTYHRCCPWIYGTCSTDADCCPGTRCVQGDVFDQCLSVGGAVCIDHMACASGQCNVERPGTSSFFCRCDDGSDSCCLPGGTPCTYDEECCSWVCDAYRCS